MTCGGYRKSSKCYIKERMISMNIIISSFILLLISNAAIASDNVCQIGELQEHGNGHFSLGVYLENSDTLAGYQIPVSFDFGETVISCDSISFAGGRCQDFEFLDSKIDNQVKVAYLMGISEASVGGSFEPLYPDTGEIARIYFTYSGTPGEGEKLKLNRSVWKLGDNKLDYRFWTPDAVEVRCRFKVDNIRLSGQ